MLLYGQIGIKVHSTILLIYVFICVCVCKIQECLTAFESRSNFLNPDEHV